MRKLSITAGVVLLIAATLAGIARRLTAKDAKLRLKDGTWHEEGGYANAQAALKEPGKPTQQRRGLADHPRGGHAMTLAARCRALVPCAA
jgi:hypothetical protein